MVIYWTGNFFNIIYKVSSIKNAYLSIKYEGIKSDNFFFNFSNLLKKRCQRGRRLQCQRPQSVFWRESSKRGRWKKDYIKKSKESTKNNNNKNWIFFLLFETAPKMPRGTPSTSSTPSKCFWRGEEAAESSSSKCSMDSYFVQLNWLWKVEFSSQPIWILESNDNINTFLTGY